MLSVPLKAAAFVLLIPLSSCIGDIEGPDDYDTDPETHPVFGLTDPPVGGQHMNGLMFSALTTDPDTVRSLLSYPLSSDVYTKKVAVGSELYNLQLRASDPDTVQFFDYLVKCALEVGQEPVKRINPHDSSDITVHPGAVGMCPQWADGPVLDDHDCTEKVSACLLSLVNDLDVHVGVSLRGRDATGDAIQLAPQATPHTFGASAFDYCYSPSYGPDATCGWEPGLVGTCQPGAEVILGRPSGCGPFGPYDSRRVCSGVFGCDMSSPTHIASGWTCLSSDIHFTCPKDGAYTVMTRTLYGAQHDETTLVSPVSGIGAARFPASEKAVYRFQEGGFFGEIFDPTGATVSILTDVRWNASSGTIDKLFSEDGGATWRTQLPNNPNRVIYQEMFACHSAEWDFYTVYDKGRVCAGSTGWGCAATHVGNCEPRSNHLDPDSVLITIEDGACAYMDAPPVSGDGDYGKCNDQEPGKLNKTWDNVITTWLVHPCDLWGPASTARETCLENSLPPVKRIIKPLPIGGFGFRN